MEVVWQWSEPPLPGAVKSIPASVFPQQLFFDGTDAPDDISIVRKELLERIETRASVYRGYPGA
jgi:hypothetical protein